MMIAQNVCPRQRQWDALPFRPPRPRCTPSPLSFPNSQLFHFLSFPAKITLGKPCRSRSRSGSSSDDPKLKEENSFFDEDGVVQDMDGYLNYLSLEYDSVWDTKPSWSSTVVTAVVLTLICGWWYIFLYSYPKAYSDMIAERRKKVTSGQEDTYGVRQSNEL